MSSEYPACTLLVANPGTFAGHVLKFGMAFTTPLGIKDVVLLTNSDVNLLVSIFNLTEFDNGVIRRSAKMFIVDDSDS